MEMTMTMPMNGFMEMTDNEMFEVDGGSRKSSFYGGCFLIAIATIGVILAPEGAGVWATVAVGGLRMTQS